MSSSEGGGAAGSPSPKTGVSGAWGVLGVLLAVPALAINFVVPGPMGPTGPAGADGQDGGTGQTGADGIDCWDLNGNGAPDLGTEDRNLDAQVDVLDCTGPQGPSGPGTLMASAAIPGGVSGPVGCTDILGVQLAPATQGTIVVTLTTFLIVDHTNGVDDLIDFYGGGCTGSITAGELFPASLPTGTYDLSVTVQWTVTVGSPGPYSIPVGVQWSAGVNMGDVLWRPLLVAVFYPA